VPSVELYTGNMGAGDIWSATHDLAHWNAALATPGQVLSAASRQAMFTPDVLTDGDNLAGLPDRSYGYGWYIAKVAGRKSYFHPRDNPGFFALTIQQPGDDRMVILCSNTIHSDLVEIGLRLISEPACGHS
jgi:CubicO group peptidase (beta-lactamase class C family)